MTVYKIGDVYYCSSCVDTHADLAQAVAVPASGLELVCAVSIESVNGNPTFATHTRRCGRCDKKLLSALQEGTMLLEHFREGTMRYLPDSNEWVRRG